MLRFIGYIMIVLFLVSCGNNHSFLKQKYTSLKKIKPQTEKSISTLEEDHLFAEVKDEEFRIEKDIELNLQPFNQLKIDTPEIKKDSLTKRNFNYADLIKKGIRLNRRFILNKDEKLYELNDVSYNDSTGVFSARVDSTGDMEIDKYDHMITVSRFTIKSGSAILVNEEDILEYQHGELHPEEESVISDKSDQNELSDEMRDKEQRKKSAGAIGFTASAILLFIIVVLSFVGLLFVSFILAFAGGTISSLFLVLLAVLAVVGLIFLILGIKKAKEANDLKNE
jgi:predicted nucleic acid-binding Zn ribbon protein